MYESGEVSRCTDEAAVVTGSDFTYKCSGDCSWSHVLNCTRILAQYNTIEYNTIFVYYELTQFMVGTRIQHYVVKKCVYCHSGPVV